MELSPKGVNRLAAKLLSSVASAVGESKLSISFSLDSRYLFGGGVLINGFIGWLPPAVVVLGVSPGLPPRDRGIENDCWVGSAAVSGWFWPGCWLVVSVLVLGRTDGDTHCSARRLCRLYIVSSVSRFTSKHPSAACKAGLIGVEDDWWFGDSTEERLLISKTPAASELILMFWHSSA